MLMAGYGRTSLTKPVRGGEYPIFLGAKWHMSTKLFDDDEHALSLGYLALKPSTIEGGALSFPLWAAAHPEFIDGDDIVITDDILGVSLRNAGGKAAAEGTFQAFATNVDGIQSMDSDTVGLRTDTAVQAGSGNRRYRTKSDTARNLIGGANETRSDNFAYQLYSVVDTHPVKI